MAKLLHPGDPSRYVPPGQDHLPEDKRVAYLLKTPSVFDAAAYERACVAAGAKTWTYAEFIVAMAEGVRVILPGDENADERDAIVAEIDAHRATLSELLAERAAIIKSGPQDGASADDLADWTLRFATTLGNPRMGELEAIVRQHYPRYRGMMADNEVAPLLRGIEAARLFLVGWENVSGDVKRGLRGADDATLARIPRDEFPGIAAFVEGLLRPTETEAGNSESPSGGASAAPRSPAARTPRRKAR